MAGNVEIWLEPGGDFIQTENGDLLLAIDTANSADASRQRIQRLLLTNPRLVADDGTPVSTPDDLFNPDYGAGLPALVDQPITTAFLAQLQARILNALGNDPTIAQSPSPVVNVTQNGGTVNVSLVATTVTGLPVVVPSLPLSGSVS